MPALERAARSIASNGVMLSGALEERSRDRSAAVPLVHERKAAKWRARQIR